jgi:outer membrane receptor protein involved in Fe transport
MELMKPAKNAATLSKRNSMPRRGQSALRASAGDPPLEQVVARTWEAGIRNGAQGPLTWSVGFFRADNYNDILFVTSEQSGFGYFKNFGRTQRQGIEVGLRGTISKKLTLSGGYTFLDATYASEETVNGSGNSTNGTGSGLEGVIEIEPGDRIFSPTPCLKRSLTISPESLQPGPSVFAFQPSLAAMRTTFTSLSRPIIWPRGVAGYGASECRTASRRSSRAK